MRIILKKGTFDFSNHQFMSLYYKTTLQIGQWGTYLDIQFPALLQDIKSYTCFQEISQKVTSPITGHTVKKRKLF